LLAQGSLLDVDSFGRAVPMVHYPPLFPFILAAVSWMFHVDPVVAARWLIAGLFGINTALLGLAGWRFLNSPRLGLLAACLALVFTPMVALHQMALSEPLYICFALIAFALIVCHLDDPGMIRLILAAAAAAMAFLTRYAGAAVVLTGCLALLFLQRKKFDRAIRDALVYSVVSCLPVGAWLIRNHLESGSPSDFLNGKFMNLAASLNTIVAGIDTVATWFLPGDLPLFLRVGFSAVLAVGLIIAGRIYGREGSRRYPQRDVLPAAAGLFVICNLVVLLATVLLLDGTTPVDDRLLLPLFAPLCLLLLWTLRTIHQRAGGTLVRFALPAVVIGLLVLTNSLRSAKHLLATSSSGRGYAGKEWQTSNLLAELRSTVGDAPIYTTLPSVIRFLTQQQVRQVPNTFSPRTERRNDNYESEMALLSRESQDPGIVLVYFKSSVNRWYPSEAELVQALDLTLLISDAQGSLYVSPRLASARRVAAFAGISQVGSR
jgi:dolichyl-phosphate-mannose-protein mannosyltransferase